MRHLIIRRNKSFVGCLAKMKVYIEDFENYELIINDVPCRELGTIKNGEEKVFQISENQAKIFVIADKLSKSFCNEFFNIPHGEDDIFLSGQNRYNPATGNAFRFNGVVDGEVIENRKRSTKIGLLVLLAAFVVGIAIGLISSLGFFSSNVISPEQFSKDGMTITLTNEFIESDIEGFTVCYDSADVAVLALKEEFSLAEGFGDLSLSEYGDLVLQNGTFESSVELKNSDGLHILNIRRKALKQGKIMIIQLFCIKPMMLFG